MKKVQKHLIMLVSAVLLTGLITGCGKGEPDPNSGRYDAITAETNGISLAASEVFGDGLAIELKDGGKATLHFDGEDYSMKWTLDGNDFQAKGSGAELNGVLVDGMMWIEDLQGTGVNIEFVCNDILMAQSSKNNGEAQGDASGAYTASGSVLQRLKDAKAGNTVYISKGSLDNDTSWLSGSGDSSGSDSGDDDRSFSDSGDDQGSGDPGNEVENGGGPGIWADFNPDDSWYEPKNKLPLTVLQEAEKKMYEDIRAYTSENKKTPTYEEVRDNYFNGVDGEPISYTASNFLGDPSAGCLWHADVDGSAYISVSFTGDSEGTLRLEDYFISDSEHFPDSPRN